MLERCTREVRALLGTEAALFLIAGEGYDRPTPRVLRGSVQSEKLLKKRGQRRLLVGECAAPRLALPAQQRPLEVI